MNKLSKQLMALLLGLCASALGAHVAAAAEPFQWDRQVQRGQLENGFSYYIVSGGEEMGRQVAMQLVVQVGSLDERDDQSGVAHMVEHMVFHASKNHPEGVRAYMEGQGWRVGSHYNANTNFDRTLYVLATDQKPEHQAAALGVLGDIAGGAQMPAEGLERERPIVLEEWRTKLGVRERMDRQRRAMLRAGSLYPQRPTIGTESSIRQQPAEALRAFYADWYRPANMALIVVGNVDVATLKSRIAAQFGGLVPGAVPERNAADPVLHDQLRIVRLQDAESGASQVGWVNRFAVDKRQDAAGLRERIIDRIAERSLRALVRRVADDLPAGVESLSSSKGELGEATASLGFAASVAVDGHQAGLRQILLLRERVRREGLDHADIEKEIAEVRRLNDKGPSQQAERDASVWLQYLLEAVQAERVLQDPAQKQAQIRHILGTLVAQDINARVQQWLAAPDRLVFMMAPGLSPLTLPSAAEVRTQQQQAQDSALPALHQVKLAATPPTMPEVTTTGVIVREDALGSGVQRWTLANGDVVVWQHAPRETVQRFAAHSSAGYRQPGAPAWQWQLAAQLGSNADLDGQAPGDLARWSAARTLHLSQQQSDTQLSYTAQVPPGQLDDLLRLVAARQSHTALSPLALRAAARQLARQAARLPDSAGERAAQEMARLRYGALPLDGYPDAAALRTLATPAAIATVRQQWQQMTAMPVTYFLSGPVDAEQVKGYVRRYLAGVPRRAAAPAPSALSQQEGYRESRLDISVEPQGSVRAMGSQAMRWTPERAMRTAILSRIIYRSLKQELREKQSGIYRLNYKLSLDPQQQLQSELSFTAAPDRLDALWSIAMRVLERLPEQLDAAVLKEEIEAMRSTEAKRVGDATTRFSRLQLTYAQYGDARYLEDSQLLAAALTPDGLRELAREFTLTRNLAVVKVLPLNVAKRD